LAMTERQLHDERERRRRQNSKRNALQQAGARAAPAQQGIQGGNVNQPQAMPAQQGMQGRPQARAADVEQSYAMPGQIETGYAQPAVPQSNVAPPQARPAVNQRALQYGLPGDYSMSPRARMMQEQQAQPAGRSPMQFMLNRMRAGGNMAPFRTMGGYGQQQGFGQGYRMPRRHIGGEHYPAWARQQSPGMGYSPRTAGRFGGRPRQMDQMQAMTRPQWSPRAYNQQPWGGNRAVPRYQNY
jgi:hypothetical protein